ncbi:MAG: hypothetical protein IT367_04750 [Candidatus Hydrogenedentes bacterium]|nr:hypothetical protein [Candidatus Hydrogenedentota bacterium]
MNRSRTKFDFFFALAAFVCGALAGAQTFSIDAIKIKPIDAHNNQQWVCVPPSGESNTEQRFFKVKISRPGGAMSTNVSCCFISGKSGDEFSEIFSVAPGNAARENNDTKLRVRFTFGKHHPSNIVTTPPRCDTVIHEITVESELDSVALPPAVAMTRPLHALWRSASVFGLPRVATRDPGGDDWASRSTYVWLDEHRDLLTPINDISGEHGRNIGHDTHAKGADINMSHFTNLLPPFQPYSGSANYTKLQQRTLEALLGNPIFKLIVANWIVEAREDRCADSARLRRKDPLCVRLGLRTSAQRLGAVAHAEGKFRHAGWLHRPSRHPGMAGRQNAVRHDPQRSRHIDLDSVALHTGM